MSQLIKIIGLSWCCLIAGCSYLKSNSIIEDRDTHYLQAQSIPPLQIPAGIDSDKFHTRYPIAERAYSTQSKNVSIVPPGL